jgi:hypothetical protein
LFASFAFGASGWRYGLLPTPFTFSSGILFPFFRFSFPFSFRRQERVNYHFPGWPVTIQERANLMASLSAYGKTTKLHSGNALHLLFIALRTVASWSLEYEVHGKILSSRAPYDNRLISVVTIENRKIVYGRDYMDSLAAGTALNGS